MVPHFRGVLAYGKNLTAVPMLFIWSNPAAVPTVSGILRGFWTKFLGTAAGLGWLKNDTHEAPTEKVTFCNYGHLGVVGTAAGLNKNRSRKHGLGV